MYYFRHSYFAKDLYFSPFPSTLTYTLNEWQATRKASKHFLRATQSDNWKPKFIPNQPKEILVSDTKITVWEKEMKNNPSHAAVAFDWSALVTKEHFSTIDKLQFQGVKKKKKYYFFVTFFQCLTVTSCTRRLSGVKKGRREGPAPKLTRTTGEVSSRQTRNCLQLVRGRGHNCC